MGRDYSRCRGSRSPQQALLLLALPDGELDSALRGAVAGLLRFPHRQPLVLYAFFLDETLFRDREPPSLELLHLGLRHRLAVAQPLVLILRRLPPPLRRPARP